MVAEDRETAHSSQLNELLNAMDGLEGDTDIQFILTTNRADVLERALKSRPGRIDHSEEIPLPDAACRKRIFELFSRNEEHSIDDFDAWVARTDGASATYIRELMRRAATESSREGDAICIETRHLEKAHAELVEVGGALTKSILGFHQPEPKSEPDSSPER